MAIRRIPTIILKIKRKKKICIFISLIFLIIGIFLVGAFLHNFYLLCSNLTAKKIIKNACELYKQQKITGNMCEDMCNNSYFVFTSCLSWHAGKQIVFQAKWRNEIVIIKSDQSEFSNYYLHGYMANDNNFDINSFVKMIADSILFNLNFNITAVIEIDQLATKLWTMDFQHSVTHGNIKASVNSLWSLMQQEEYVLFKAFNGYQFFPKIIGSCGHLYGVEFTPSDAKQLQIPSFFHSSLPWLSRARVALQLLDLVQGFQFDFHEPLFLCDIKVDNFGIDRESKIKVIDVDSAFFESGLRRQMMVSTCNTHEDCAFFDCKCKCNTLKKQCFHEISNNNLQVICEKIFLNNNFQKISGLLKGPSKAVEKELLDILIDCANPDKSHDPYLREAATEETYKKLYHFLEDAIMKKSYHRIPI